ARWEALLVDLLAVDARREAVQHARPLPQRADDPVADGDVVAGERELGIAAGREVDPVRARDPHGPAIDCQFDRFAVAFCAAHLRIRPGTAKDLIDREQSMTAMKIKTFGPVEERSL